VQWPVSVVQKPLGLRQSEKIPSKNFRVQRLEMAKQMKNIRQQRADERDKAAQIFTWCMVVAMHQEEGIGATRLERACNEMHEFQQRYRTKILTENRKSATDAMREDLKGICDFEVRLPQTKAPRNRREEQLRMAQNEGAEIAWLVMAATTHLTFGFGKERLARLKQETLDNYRQYIGWVEQDGEALCNGTASPLFGTGFAGRTQNQRYAGKQRSYPARRLRRSPEGRYAAGDGSCIG
jgi:hypothetical protein